MNIHPWLHCDDPSLLPHSFPPHEPGRDAFHRRSTASESLMRKIPDAVERVPTQSPLLRNLMQACTEETRPLSCERARMCLARRAAILAAAVPTATRALEFSNLRASRCCCGLEGHAPLNTYARTTHLNHGFRRKRRTQLEAPSPADQFSRLSHSPGRRRHFHSRPARRNFSGLHEFFARLFCRRPSARRDIGQRGHLRLWRRG